MNKMKKRHSHIMTCLALMLLAASPACSQKLTERLGSIFTTKRLPGKIDSLLTVREARREYDTMYIQRPEENWTFKVKSNATGWKIRSMHNGGLSNVLESPIKYTLAVAAGYRGLTIGAKLNPAKIIGKNSDLELSISSYGNKMGGEVFVHRSSDFDATAKLHGSKYDISESVQHISMLNASGYYVFNSKKFSYPAPFSHNYIQKKSAGSWMLGATLFSAHGHLSQSEEATLADTKISMLMIGVGGGYGYNFVLPHQWLVPVSAVPNVVIAQHNKRTVSGNKERMRYKFPELMNTGRIAVMHSFNNYFAGTSGIVNLNIIGNHRDLFMENLKWNASVYVGVRM